MRKIVFSVIGLLFAAAIGLWAPAGQTWIVQADGPVKIYVPILGAVVTDNPNPPASPVKLIFIHHSTGGNWLAAPAGLQPSETPLTNSSTSSSSA